MRRRTVPPKSKENEIPQGKGVQWFRDDKTFFFWRPSEWGARVTAAHGSARGGAPHTRKRRGAGESVAASTGVRRRARRGRGGRRWKAGRKGIDRASAAV